MDPVVHNWENNPGNALGKTYVGLAAIAIPGGAALKGLRVAKVTEEVAVSTSAFSDGALFETSIASTAGEIGVLADVSVRGGTLTLSDIAMYGSGSMVNQVGASTLLQARTALAQTAADAGFDVLRLTGVRVPGSSALKPGRVVDFTIELAPYK